MIYTKAVREYCLQNEGIVFDISKEYKNHFSMMPYKTFCKILGRLEEEGILVRESHGAECFQIQIGAAHSCIWVHRRNL